VVACKLLPVYRARPVNRPRISEARIHSIRDQIHRTFDYAVACAPTALRMTLLRGVAIFESQSKTGDEMDGMLTMQQAS
jgi:hypothetical protein